MSTRGFVTIASGSEKYYIMAANLLRSYRRHVKDSTPFAIICDQENTVTNEFDKVVLMDQADCSYMDKLKLYRYAPYDETIFIDADSLVLSDVSGIWDDFSDADDVSCYGWTYPLDSDRAWFTYDGCGEYKEKIRFLIDLHGGIYYLRKGARCDSIFQTATGLARQYDQYSFKHFEKPADEPVIAMSLAIHQSRPCDKPMRVLFYPSYWGKVSVHASGELTVRGGPKREILHFGTQNTERFLYRYLVEIDKQSNVSRVNTILRYAKIWFQTAPREAIAFCRHSAGKVLRRVLPTAVVERIKERL